MRYRMVLMALLSVSAADSLAAVNPGATGVFWPRSGVVCDTAGHFCAGAGGISPWLTGRYLGERARATLEEMTGDNAGRDMTRFTLSNGVWCETAARTCWRTGRDGRPHISEVATHELYGQ